MQVSQNGAVAPSQIEPVRFDVLVTHSTKQNLTAGQVDNIEIAAGALVDAFDALVIASKRLRGAGVGGGDMERLADAMAAVWAYRNKAKLVAWDAGRGRK